MPLTTIFIIRHAFRGAWDTNPRTGEVSSRFPTPTGLPADPVLTAYGERQADELGELAHKLDPPVVRIYSSPYYRCLQTIAPFARRRPDLPVILDRGIGEWYGEAPWEQPKPAPFGDLTWLFPDLKLRQYPGLDPQDMEMLKDYDVQLRSLEQVNRRRIKKAEHKRAISQSKKAAAADIALKEYQRQLQQFEEQSRQRADQVASVRLSTDPANAPGLHLLSQGSALNSIVPASRGESTAELHNRIAYALNQIVETNDMLLENDPDPRSIVLVSHAAPIIAAGRTLTGNMPPDISEEDFCTYTAGITRFDRRTDWQGRVDTIDPAPMWQDGGSVPHIAWRDGNGVQGGWDCTVNSGTDHLSGGGDRDWHFSGEESFLPLPGQAPSVAAASEEKPKL